MNETDVTVHIGSIHMSTNDGPAELQFASREFDRTVVHEMGDFLGTEVTLSSGMLLIIIERWQPWFGAALQATIPSFPLDILYNIESDNERVQATASLPTFNEFGDTLSFVMDHVDIFRKRGGATRNALDLGTCEVRRLALATWICPSGGIESHPDRPIAVMAGVQTRDILQQLESHYFGDGHRRWNRLSDLPYWLYLDLYGLLTRWDKVWDVARGVVSHREAELQGHVKAPPILRQARALHQDTATNIALREHIRVHKASLAEYERGIKQLKRNKTSKQHLLKRIWIISKALDHYEVSAETNLEQLQNLLSLAFNIETVAQGQSVSRLNLFAFIFLPLSFIASVFGITTMTAPPQWYPVAAAGALLLTGLVIIGSRKVQKMLEEHEKASGRKSRFTRKRKAFIEEDSIDIEMHIPVSNQSLDRSTPLSRPPLSRPPLSPARGASTKRSARGSTSPSPVPSIQPIIVPQKSNHPNRPSHDTLSDLRPLDEYALVRGSRITAGEVEYYSTPRVDQESNSMNRRRMVDTERIGSGRRSEYTFQDRKSLPADVRDWEQLTQARRVSPTRPRPKKAG